MKSIAIVTGASSGAGREFVRQLDAGIGGPISEIWVIARRQDRLDEVAASCTTPVRTFALDLTDPASFDVVSEALEAEPSANVQWLVNSAGFGKFGEFGTIGERGNAGMVRLNCLAVVEMCYRCILYMHAGSRIINMASVAALVPQPELTVYSASKRFVLDFSRALDAEMGGVGIHVTAVCPKFMDTEFLSKPGDPEAVKHMTFIGFEKPANVVGTAIRSAIRGRSMCVPSPDMKVVHVASKVLPTRFVMAAERVLGDWASRDLT
ncbi:MAG: SDR family NAD(P)-dependent oxidoreductase [Atopobiaceae bacterium]|jgi:short-subunit dehydrogenase|nr:SDR family NAD(P)-dependent oxidoreductase [Atopobiaceae bacterium]MCI2172859.1 SDR family NAD(P)-dependent oxidoreductase [Atopobiaceae bacterium]MCI2207166.1 SDR family NAD(P)-dependent oxidoreductase [Atopobiaceae bacterium]